MYTYIVYIPADNTHFSPFFHPYEQLNTKDPKLYMHKPNSVQIISVYTFE